MESNDGRKSCAAAGTGENAVASGTGALKLERTILSARERMLYPANGRFSQKEVNNRYHLLQDEYGTTTRVSLITNFVSVLVYGTQVELRILSACCLNVYRR